MNLLQCVLFYVLVFWLRVCGILASGPRIELPAEGLFLLQGADNFRPRGCAYPELTPAHA